MAQLAAVYDRCALVDNRKVMYLMTRGVKTKYEEVFVSHAKRLHDESMAMGPIAGRCSRAITVANATAQHERAVQMLTNVHERVSQAAFEDVHAQKTACLKILQFALDAQSTMLQIFARNNKFTATVKHEEKFQLAQKYFAKFLTDPVRKAEATKAAASSQRVLDAAKKGAAAALVEEREAGKIQKSAEHREQQCRALVAQRVSRVGLVQQEIDHMTVAAENTKYTVTAARSIQYCAETIAAFANPPPPPPTSNEAARIICDRVVQEAGWAVGEANLDLTNSLKLCGAVAKRVIVEEGHVHMQVCTMLQRVQWPTPIAPTAPGGALSWPAARDAMTKPFKRAKCTKYLADWQTAVTDMSVPRAYDDLVNKGHSYKKQLMLTMFDRWFKGDFSNADAVGGEHDALRTWQRASLKRDIAMHKLHQSNAAIFELEHTAKKRLADAANLAKDTALLKKVTAAVDTNPVNTLSAGDRWFAKTPQQHLKQLQNELVEQKARTAATAAVFDASVAVESKMQHEAKMTTLLTVPALAGQKAAVEFAEKSSVEALKKYRTFWKKEADFEGAQITKTRAVQKAARCVCRLTLCVAVCSCVVYASPALCRAVCCVLRMRCVERCFVYCGCVTRFSFDARANQQPPLPSICSCPYFYRLQYQRQCQRQYQRTGTTYGRANEYECAGWNWRKHGKRWKGIATALLRRGGCTGSVSRRTSPCLSLPRPLRCALKRTLRKLRLLSLQ